MLPVLSVISLCFLGIGLYRPAMVLPARLGPTRIKVFVAWCAISLILGIPGAYQERPDSGDAPAEALSSPLEDAAAQHDAADAFNTRLLSEAEWRALSRAIVPTGEPAEIALLTYLLRWQQRDWAGMASTAQLTWRSTHPEGDSWLEATHIDLELLSAALSGEPSRGSAGWRVPVELTYVYTPGGVVRTEKTSAMVIAELSPGQPSPRGEWGVNPGSLMLEGLNGIGLVRESQ
jgi:hypothetical protein